MKLHNYSLHMNTICYRLLVKFREGVIHRGTRHVQTLLDNVEEASNKLEEFAPIVVRDLKQYHFNSVEGDLKTCLKSFELLRAKTKKVPEAEVLALKGFDRTDLLMLADEVEDEEIAKALRETTIFYRGFWAIDILR